MVKILNEAFKLCTSSSGSSFLGQSYFLGSFNLASGVMLASYISSIGQYLLIGGSGAVAGAALVIPGVLAIPCVSVTVFDLNNFYLWCVSGILCVMASAGFLLFMSFSVGGAMGMLMVLPMLCLLVECIVSACCPGIDALMNVDPTCNDNGVSVFGLMSSFSGLLLCACVVMSIPCISNSAVLNSFLSLCNDFSDMIAFLDNNGLL